MMRRAGIYFFFDQDGIVDSYVPYFIRELHKVVDYIVVVVNGELTAQGRKDLASVADDLFVRENKGFDAWAYKDAVEYIGWDHLRTFDELVIANYTCFGPVYPFKESFDKMEEDECDFWGYFSMGEDRRIKNHFGVPLKWGYRPNYIVSNFLVFKRTVLKSYEFRQFFANLPHISNYYESGVYYEMTLTSSLREAGFVGKPYDQEAFVDASPSPTVYNAYEMVTEYRIPIIRRKVFFDPNGSLDYCTDIPRQLMWYIDGKTGYDSNLIWQNLLRTNNLYDLKNWFNWNNILPLDYSRPLPQGKRIAVIFHAYYEDMIIQYLHNFESFPEGTDFYFTTDMEEKISALQQALAPFSKRFHIKYRTVENRGRDVSALLVGCRDVVLEGGYDLICFMHDKKGIGGVGLYSCEEKHFSDCCFENVAPTADYVNNVVALFERQPQLGLAVPPTPRNQSFYKVIGGSWLGDYNNVQKLLCELKIQVPLNGGKPPVAPYGTAFWFRPCALRPLFERNWKYDDFDAEPARNNGLLVHAVKRAYVFIAQSLGYYTSVIMSSAYAEQEVTQMTEIASTFVRLTLKNAGACGRLSQATAKLSRMLPLQAVQNKTARNTAANPRRKPNPLKSFARAVCPIGIWNILRRVRCAVVGEVYVDPTVKRGFVKSAVRACLPRFIWNALRKERCRRNGLVFVEE